MRRRPAAVCARGVRWGRCLGGSGAASTSGYSVATTPTWLCSGRSLSVGEHGGRPGLALHLVNGAAFGLVYYEARRRWPQRPRRLAMSMALGEHVALYPLSYFVDRFHPRRGTRGIPPLLENPRAFAQATWRHTIFGLVLGRLA